MPEIISIGGMELRFLQTGASTDGGADVFEMAVQPNTHMPVPHHHETWGETVFVKRGIAHGFRSDTRLPAQCLAILTPGVFGPACCPK